MSVAFVKKASGQSGSASTTLTLTMASAPTAGNFLLFAMAGDKNTGALTLAGFTQLYTLNSTSVSLYLWYKISDGTEASIAPSWAASSSTGNVAWYGEFEDTAVTGATTWQISGQASHNTDETNVTSWSTGTTGILTASGLGVAVITMDSADSVVDGTTVWTNSYASLFTTLASAGARGGLHMADLLVSSGATTETTFSFTPSTTLRDQLSGAVVVITKASTGTSASAGQPTGAGAASDAASALGVLPDTPTGAGAASDAVSALGVTTGIPSATGSALDATALPGVLALLDTSFAVGSALDALAVPGVLGSAGLASGTGSAPDTTAAAGSLPDTPVAAGVAFDAAALTAVSVTAGVATVDGTAYGVTQGVPQTVLRVRVTGREPVGRAGGTEPVSSWVGREPVTTASGEEAGTP